MKMVVVCRSKAILFCHILWLVFLFFASYQAALFRTLSSCQHFNVYYYIIQHEVLTNR